MHKEYAAVVDAGFVLQLDAPDLAMERTMLFQDKTDGEFVKVLEQHIAALNLAIEGLPADRVRLHVCWGNWEGPHVHDVPMEVILPTLYKAKVGALGLEFGNSRKQHETAAMEAQLPDNMTLVAGVIDSKSNMVEHPEVVAQRIEAVVSAVGDRERVIAGVDCGFGAFVGWEWVTEDVVWAKLKTLRRGADIASIALGQEAPEPRGAPRGSTHAHPFPPFPRRAALPRGRRTITGRWRRRDEFQPGMFENVSAYECENASMIFPNGSSQ